jgi:1-acyl-sn-glycerol-3-phosphate acyltransferase
MRLRRFRRAVTLGLILALCVVRFWLLRLKGPRTLERRALWGQATGKQLMAALGIRYKVTGLLPERGLLVSNHLSYLDILIYGTVVPCFFVSKAEIRRWPFFGWMSNAGGTLYVDRSSRASAESVTDQIAERLKGTVPVLFFPEGTSSDGSQLLRFHSRFFTPAVAGRVPVTAAAVRYVSGDGAPERELCWFGDAPFLPHLWKALGAPGFTAEVHFAEPRVYPDRRTAADETHTEIEAMRSGGVLALQ